MKKIITLLALSSLVSLPSFASGLSDKIKHQVCNGRYAPTNSPVFGQLNVESDKDIEILNADVNHMRMKPHSRDHINIKHMQLKTFLKMMGEQKDDYSQMEDTHYGESKQVYNETNSNMDKVTREQKNSVKREVKAYLLTDLYVFPGKFKPVQKNGLELVKICREYWADNQQSQHPYGSYDPYGGNKQIDVYNPVKQRH